MSNIGYREIFDFSELSLKQLNDNMRALWSKVMGDIEYRDLSGAARSVIDSKAASADLTAYSTLTQTAEAIESAVTALDVGQYSTASQTAAAIETAVYNLNVGQYATGEDLNDAIAGLNVAQYSTITQTAESIQTAVADLNVDQYATSEDVTAAIDGLNIAQYATTEQTANQISTAVYNLNLGQYATAGDVEAAIDALNVSQYSTTAQTATQIESAVHDLNLSQYATLTQTASAITAALSDSSNTTNVKITAAHGLTITQSGTGSYFRANASNIGFYTSGGALLGGFDATGAFCASKLRDASDLVPGRDFYVRVVDDSSTWDSGMELYYSSSGAATRRGGLYVDPLRGGVYISAASRIGLRAEGSGALTLYTDTVNNNVRNLVECAAHVVPSGAGFNLGLNAGGYRFNDLNYAGSLNQSSDRRVKRDIAPLNAADLLERLRPVRFRMIEGDGKLRFGLIAQEVAEALQGADYVDAALYNDENPDSLGLCLTELIAVLIEGFQAQARRIAALEAALARLT